MKSTNAYLISVTLPYGAQPGSARLFFGAAKDFPPALITYLQGNGFDPVGGIIAYADSGGSTDTQYVFFVEAVSFPGEFPASWVVGSFNSPLFQTQAIFDASTVFIGPFGEGITLGIGSGAGAASITIVPTSFVQFDDGSTLTIGQGGGVSGVTVEVKNLSTVTFDSGARLETASGSVTVFDPGSGVNFEGATEFHSGASTTFDTGAGLQLNNAVLVGAAGGIEFQSGGLLKMDWDAEIEIDPNGSIGPVKQGRGLLVAKAATGSTSGNTFFPTQFQLPSATFRNGRAFLGIAHATWSHSIANTQTTFNLTNGVGTTIAGTYRTEPLPLVASQMDLWHFFKFRNNSGADVSTGMEIKISGAANTAVDGAGANPTTFEIYDIGDAGSYSGYPSF